MSLQAMNMEVLYVRRTRKTRLLSLQPVGASLESGLQSGLQCGLQCGLQSGLQRKDDEFEEFRRRSYHGGGEGLLDQQLLQVPVPAVRLFDNHPHHVHSTETLHQTTPPRSNTPALTEEHTGKALVATDRTQQEMEQKELPPNKASPDTSIRSATEARINCSSGQTCPRSSRSAQPQQIPTILMAPSHERVLSKPEDMSLCRTPTNALLKCTKFLLLPSCLPGSSVSAAVLNPMLGTPGTAEKGGDRPVYRILVVGAEGVGKRRLFRQFAKADEQDKNDDDDDFTQGGSVSSVIGGEKSDLMVFIKSADQTPSNFARVDAYIVMYAINDRHSFKYACLMVQHIRSHYGQEVPIVLAGNKGDMERNRAVPQKAGRNLAILHHCTHMEISASLNICVDELFIDLLDQMQRRRLGKTNSNVFLKMKAALKAANIWTRLVRRGS